MKVPWTRRPPLGLLHRPNGRTETVRRLIERTIVETGSTPTDEALAKMLACSISRIRQHRGLLRL